MVDISSVQDIQDIKIITNKIITSQILLLLLIKKNSKSEPYIFGNLPDEKTPSKKVSDFPVTTQDVTNQTLHGQEKFNYS
jgi:hypothetical protein